MDRPTRRFVSPLGFDEAIAASSLIVVGVESTATSWPFVRRTSSCLKTHCDAKPRGKSPARNWRKNTSCDSRGLQLARTSLNGDMAEALFADRNPDWNYVRSPERTAARFHSPAARWWPTREPPSQVPSQRRPGDIYQGHGQRLASPQVCSSGRPFRCDPRQAKRRIPPLERDWRCRRRKSGSRNLGRLRRGGFTSQEVIDGRKEASGFSARQKYATYLSFGASLILSLGPTAWDAVNGRISAKPPCTGSRER